MSRIPGKLLSVAVLAASVLVIGVPQAPGPVSAAVGAGSTYELQVGGRAGVPADAEAAVLNVTAARSAGRGFVTVYPCGESKPTASNLNFSAGPPTANMAIAQLGAGGKVCLFSSSPTDLVVDVAGWLPAGSDYSGRNPSRLLDTRTAAAVGAGSTYELQVGGRAGVPADAEAAVLNVTAARSAGRGFVTVYPCGESKPTASNLNFSAGPPTANMAIAQLGAGGKVCLFSSSPTDLVVDVAGWLPAGSDYSGRNPSRLLDTRTAAAVGAGSTYELQVGGRAGVPADAEAAVLNVTAARSAGRGFVTVYPCGESKPTASNLNFSAGPPTANMAIAQLGAGGKVCLFSSSPTDLVVDVAGWLPAGSDYSGRNPSRLLDTRTMKWSQVSAGSQREATITIPADAYPNSAGVTFHKNGTLNRTDSTGPQEDSRYHFWPAIDLSSGDQLTATWTDKVGTRHTSTHIVAGGSGGGSTPSGGGSSGGGSTPSGGGGSSGGSQPPTPPSVGGKAFFDSFESMSWDAFRTGVYHRDVDAHGFPMESKTWQGDHDLSCGSPATKRTLDKSDRSSSFYVCNPGPSGTNQHGMTSVGHVDSYSVAWFSPKQTFSSISEVCWDVNISTDVLGHRQWWEVMVAPVNAPDVTAISWLAGTANLPDYGEAGAVVLGFGPDNPPIAKLSVGNSVVGRATTNDPDGRSDVRIRRPHCLADNGDGTITYSTVNGDGSGESFTASGSFPAGELKVVFKDHNYTPKKDCTMMPGGECESYTWHWDNIVVRD